jgi:predicted RNA binding protein YcfA (HicA-like mRNA interferase family)
MRAIAGREFARMIERRGWQLLRISGSHHIYGKPGSIVRLSVPIHGNRPLKTGPLRHLAKAC